MWTKRNDHVPISECNDSFNVCPKEVILERLKFDHFFLSFLIFNFSSSKKFIKNL
jgi:hypothetical protein